MFSNLLNKTFLLASRSHTHSISVQFHKFSAITTITGRWLTPALLLYHVQLTLRTLTFRLQFSLPVLLEAPGREVCVCSHILPSPSSWHSCAAGNLLFQDFFWIAQDLPLTLEWVIIAFPPHRGNSFFFFKYQIWNFQKVISSFFVVFLLHGLGVGGALIVEVAVLMLLLLNWSFRMLSIQVVAYNTQWPSDLRMCST